MLITLLIFPLTAFYICLFLLSKKSSDGYDEVLKEYDFKIPYLASVGLYLSEKIPISISPRYDRGIQCKISELFGQKQAAVFFKVHNAQKLGLLAALTFVLGVTGLLGKVSLSFIFYGLILNCLVYYLVDRELDKKIEDKKRQILIDLPTFINTLTLLLSAGLTYSASVQKIVGEADFKRPLYRELHYLISEIHAGKPMGRAYEDFAQRCRVPEITRLVSTIQQNLNRGNSDLSYVLTILAQECWQKRKDIAKKQGEEASSKLVFPMVMIFIAVSIIVLAPALMSVTNN
ncbi:MAG: type II secretion system F family protein [Bacillota bacterium]